MLQKCTMTSDRKYRILCQFAIILMFVNGLMVTNNTAAQAGDQSIALACEDLPIVECIRNISVEVRMPESIAMKKVSLRSAEGAPDVIIRQVLDAADVNHYVVDYRKSENIVIVTLVGAEDNTKSKTAINADANKPLDVHIPSEQELANYQKNLNLDAEINFPGGIKTTLRELQAIESRSEGRVNLNDSSVTAPGLDKPSGYQDLVQKATNFEAISATKRNVESAVPNLNEPLSESKLKKRLEEADRMVDKVKSVTLSDGTVFEIDSPKKLEQKSQINFSLPENPTLGVSPRNENQAK